MDDPGFAYALGLRRSHVYRIAWACAAFSLFDGAVTLETGGDWEHFLQAQLGTPE